MSEAAQGTPPPDAFKPASFGKYFLLQRMAAGGMAEIYRAKTIGAGGFEKELVVKRILPAQSRDQGFVKMLINEAKLTVSLTHNNIAQIFECGAIGGDYFIAMELVNGVSLKEIMATFAKAQQVLTPEQSIFLVLQMLQGLEYAHKKTDGQGKPLKIVHCDISPDNVLVSYQGEVKLADFGIARAATGLSNYKDGMLMGKLGYVAPEQASLEKGFDHRVDIFAAGIILYELLTRSKPFPRATDVESLIECRKAKVLPPSSHSDKMPREIDEVILKALAYEPEDRFADAKAFGDALVDILFPTPQSTIQDLICRQMQQVFSQRIERASSARAHDALVMKVLVNAAVQQQQAQQRFAGGNTPAPTPLDGSVAGGGEELALAVAGPMLANGPSSSGVATAPGRPTIVRAPREIRTVRVGWLPAILVGVVCAVLGASALTAAQPYLRDGVVVITSAPPGAVVKFDGEEQRVTTPIVLDGVNMAVVHTVEITYPDYKGQSHELKPKLGRLVQRVHAPLEIAVGTLTIDSDPTNAEISINGKPAGTTPTTVRKVRLDERHRIDIKKNGYEVDQFVVLPEKDGTRFQRRLSAARK
jgi:hypothetical protein